VKTSHTIATASVATLIVLLTACSEDSLSGEPTPTVTATSEPTATATHSAIPETFSQPTKCDEILTEGRLADFADQGLVLLGGPDGRYGDNYLSDKTPEQEAGGITCIWGFDDSEESSVTISVAPLSLSNRADVVEGLSNQGLNTEVTGSSTVFWQQGDTEQQPAVVNVIEQDSWISIIETVGGQVFYDEAVDLVDEVHQNVYSPSN
jgi:hypothetical protein